MRKGWHVDTWRIDPWLSVQFSGRSRISQKDTNPWIAENLLFGKIFAKNCMKMKIIGLRRGDRPWQPLEWDVAGAHPGSPAGGCEPLGGGANKQFCQSFQKTAWNWIYFGPVGTVYHLYSSYIFADKCTDVLFAEIFQRWLPRFTVWFTDPGVGRINAVLDSRINNRDPSHLKTGLDQCPLFVMCPESSVYSVFTSENVHGQK